MLRRLSELHQVVEGLGENSLLIGKIVAAEADEAVLREMDVDDKIVIYQGRKKFSRGSAKCLISLIKPLIGSDGNVYPCCGVQYALADSSFDFDSRGGCGSRSRCCPPSSCAACCNTVGSRAAPCSARSRLISSSRFACHLRS